MRTAVHNGSLRDYLRQEANRENAIRLLKEVDSYSKGIFKSILDKGRKLSVFLSLSFADKTH